MLRHRCPLSGELAEPVLAGVHRAAQLNFGTMYQARKARMASTMITIAVYLIAAYPARPDDSGSGLWV
jgi:hypothetical protein